MQTPTRILALLCLILTGLVSISSAQDEISILYSPMVVELAGERGTTVPFEITIFNQSQSATAYFRAEVSGLHERSDGVYVPRERDDWEFDASSWVELEADEFAVPPGSLRVLRGNVRIPRQSAASGYATIVTELLPEPKPADVAAATYYYQQFSTALEVSVGRQHRRTAYISEISVIPTGSSPDLAISYGQDGLLFLATLKNEGDIHVRAQGQLIIRDEFGRRVRTVPLGTGRGVIIPDATLNLGSVLRGLLPGSYEAEVRINYGGHRPAIARATFQVDDHLLGLSSVAAGRTMRVDVTPTQMELVMPRHGYRAGTLTVANLDTSDVRFTVHVEELLHDFDGVPVNVDEGVRLPHSAAEWVTIRPEEFVLRPGQRRNVVVGFEVPEGNHGGRYARIRVEAHAEIGQGEEASHITTDLDVEAYLVLGTDHKRLLEITDFPWQQVPGTSNVVIGTVIGNAGEIHEQVSGQYRLLKFIPESEVVIDDLILVQDARWEAVEQVPADVSPTPVLPGEQRFMQAVLQTPLEPNFQYQVLFELAQPEGSPRLERIDLWVDEGLVVHPGRMEEALASADSSSEQ